MGHDEHFLQRLDRVDRSHVELALGLYRDHELIRYILANARVPADAERVAIALEGDAAGPHLVVARDGHFVTCLGRAMSTGSLPIISRAHLDGLVARVERVREGVALAKKRGFDESRLLDRLATAGAGVPREDFVAGCAVLGPAVPILLGVYASWVKAVHEMQPLLQMGRGSDAPAQRRAEEQLALGVWAMAHSAMIVAQAGSRAWVEDWSQGPAHDVGSPWSALVSQCAYPFAVRAAWLAAKFGKPMLAAYKVRYEKAPHPIEVREAGWGMIGMALRHAAIRGDVMRTLTRARPDAASDEPWIAQTRSFFADVARLVEEKEDSLRDEAMDLGRKRVVGLGEDLAEGSPHRFERPEDVPDDLALPALFDLWYDALNDERSADLMLIGVVTAARARAEDFYFPARFLHAVHPPSSKEQGQSLVEMHHKLLGIPKTVRHAEKPPGRNDPCSCGSGKKFKKCHGR
jgi:hypothetical protein